jgi:hypothetical protein
MFTGEETVDTVSGDWTADLVTVLKTGKEISLPSIYDKMEKLRKSKGRSWPKTATSTVRCTLQRHSREQEWYTGQEDLFRLVVPGVWRLK